VVMMKDTFADGLVYWFFVIAIVIANANANANANGVVIIFWGKGFALDRHLLSLTIA